VPAAAAYIGVPLGAEISTPVWNLPRLGPKREKTLPSTGHESEKEEDLEGAKGVEGASALARASSPSKPG